MKCKVILVVSTWVAAALIVLGTSVSAQACTRSSATDVGSVEAFNALKNSDQITLTLAPQANDSVELGLGCEDYRPGPEPLAIEILTHDGVMLPACGAQAPFFLVSSNPSCGASGYWLATLRAPQNGDEVNYQSLLGAR